MAIPRADKIRAVHPNDFPIVSQGHHGIIDDEENLARVNGKISHAAKLLNVGYQTLAHMIEHKYPDLLTHRTPIRRRPRRKGRASKK